MATRMLARPHGLEAFEQWRMGMIDAAEHWVTERHRMAPFSQFQQRRLQLGRLAARARSKRIRRELVATRHPVAEWRQQKIEDPKPHREYEQRAVVRHGR